MSGRHTDYTPELADQIAEYIANDKTLREIEATDGMPTKTTILRWMKKYPDFVTKCAHARVIQADVIDDRHGEVITKVENGLLSPDAGKVVLSGLQWRASKKDPKKYGDRVQQDHTGISAAVIIDNVPRS